MLNRDFREFVALLDARGVEYLVIGGYALAAHGHPRYTGDIDFWVRPTAENIARLLLALTDFGFGSLGLTADDFSADSVVQLGRAPRRIDLLTAIDGVTFDDCYARRVEVEGMTKPATRRRAETARPASPLRGRLHAKSTATAHHPSSRADRRGSRR